MTIFVVCLFACSTATYVVPSETEIAPPIWQMNSESLSNKFVVGSPKVSTGKLRAGEYFLEYEMSPSRTGIIEDEIQFQSNYGSTVVIPAGTKAYARQFSLYSQKYQNHRPIGSPVNKSEQNNPIEWCIPYEKTIYCLFWESSQSVLVNSLIRGHHPLKAAGSLSDKGTRIAVPRISEQLVEFETPLILKARIQKITKEHVYVRTYTIDPRNNNRTKVTGINHNLAWNDQGLASLEVFGGEITFSRTPEKKILFVEVTKNIPADFLPTEGIGKHGPKLLTDDLSAPK